MALSLILQITGVFLVLSKNQRHCDENCHEHTYLLILFFYHFDVYIDTTLFE